MTWTRRESSHPLNKGGGVDVCAYHFARCGDVWELRLYTLGRAGYQLTPYPPAVTESQALQCARALNAWLGLTEREAADIIASALSAPPSHE